ncbi:RNA guanine-N7 methyltransferase activating subunit [Mantella aurantiaca]
MCGVMFPFLLMTDASDIKEMFENMFTNRFTEQDEEYQEYIRKPESQPPIVEEWWGGNQRHQDRYRDNRRNRGWEDNRRDSYSSYNQHRGGRGWGNSHPQYRQERSHYHQERHHSYNSGNQRFQPYR